MTERLLISRLAFSLAARAREQARAATDSERIKEAMILRVLNIGLVAIEVPYYWAVYYHDGRGRVRARPGHKIVYFKDPDDDPRINGAARNYPKRASSIRRLTKVQFFRYLKEGKLISVDSVGPAGPHPFFTEGLRSFPSRAGSIAAPQFSAYVSAELGDLLNLRRGAKIRLR